MKKITRKSIIDKIQVRTYDFIHTSLDIFNIIPVKRSCVEIHIVIILT